MSQYVAGQVLSRHAVVSISKVEAGRRDLVELPAVAGDGVGEADDVEDLGATEADLHGTHASEAQGRPPDEGSARTSTTCGRIGVRAITRPGRAFER